MNKLRVHYWIIKGRPRENDFENCLVPHASDKWHTSRPPKSWSPGDPLFFWKASPARCVVGLGILKAVPKKKDESGNSLFGVKYLTGLLTNCPSIEELRLNTKLNDASFLKSGPAGTVFPLTDEQGKELYRVIVSKNPEIDLGWDPRAHTIAKTEAVDLAEPPGRISTTTSRIIRDTDKANQMKSKYGFRCQVCRTRIKLGSDRFYAEAHHLRPLGGRHKGLDRENNMMVLCPNHHAMFDLGVPWFVSSTRVRIYEREYDLLCKHELANDNIRYHNKHICILKLTSEESKPS